MINVVFGGAGFIGHHLISNLLAAGKRVICVDSLKSGSKNHLNKFLANDDFKFYQLDIAHTESLLKIVPHNSVIYHLASNPDIAAAASNPRIDFINGTVITESALEVARITSALHFIYTSGSGVYREDYGNVLDEGAQLLPISTYGASKLAGESLAAAYSFMFSLKVTILRFANVVGPLQTHGVGYDLLRKLKTNQDSLDIRGDGTQDKAYIHVNDVVQAIDVTVSKQIKQYDVYNVSLNETITVKEIVKMCLEQSGISHSSIGLNYESSPRGWIGDVPKIRMNSDKLRSLGWAPKYSCQEAVQDSLSAMWTEIS